MQQLRGIINEKWTCSKSKNSHKQNKETKQFVCERTLHVKYDVSKFRHIPLIHYPSSRYVIN